MFVLKVDGLKWYEIDDERDLRYAEELVAKVKKAFNVDLPKVIHFTDINETTNFLIKNIIESGK